MNIADNILKAKLSRVCFILGSGKTTAANALNELTDCAVYHTDNRAPHFALAETKYQPEMCRDVPDFFALKSEDALAWENAIVREMTPMIITDLIELAGRYPLVICEGDICVELILPIATHIVCIVNNGEGYDFFDRPDQRHLLDSIRNNPELTDEEKRVRIENAYRIVGGTDKRELPCEITEYGIHRVDRYADSTPAETARLILDYIERKNEKQIERIT